MSWSTEAIEKHAAGVRETAVEVFNRDGYHRPLSFIYASKSPDDGSAEDCIVAVAVSGTDFNPKARSKYSEQLNALCKKLDAAGVAFLSEVYMLSIEAKTADEARALRDTHGSLEHHPDACEQLFMSLEIARTGQQHFTAKIVRDAAGKPSLEPWQSHARHTRTEGRLSSLLPRQS